MIQRGSEGQVFDTFTGHEYGLRGEPFKHRRGIKDRKSKAYKRVRDSELDRSYGAPLEDNIQMTYGFVSMLSLGGAVSNTLMLHDEKLRIQNGDNKSRHSAEEKK